MLDIVREDEWMKSLQVKDGNYYTDMVMVVTDLSHLRTHVGGCHLTTVYWKVIKDHGVEFGAMRLQDG